MDAQTSDLLDTLITLVSTYGLDVVGGIVILIVGLFVAGMARRVTYRLLGRSERMDEAVRGFVASMVKVFVIAVTVIAVLSNFGIEIASLIAVLGAAGLAIGFALQGVLSNVAAGVMLLAFRPFKVGDFIETAGVAGTVKAQTLTTVELATPDNVQIIVPNGQVWGSAIRNFSFHETRRVDLAIGIGYEDSIDAASDAIAAVIAADKRALAEPAVLIAVAELADDAVQFTVRVWCKAGDYWPLRFDLMKGIKERLDAENITIPYPQRTVHVAGAAANLSGAA